MSQERPLFKSILTKGKEIATRLAKEEDGKLILVRKTQQAIWIEGGIWVEVLSIERDRVKLGITAPDDVKVMRKELLHTEPPKNTPKKPPQA